jgi:integrase/recombinase XerD
MDLQDLHREFVREKRFLLNVSPNTIDGYHESFTSFKKHHKGLLLSDLSKASLGQMVCSMRETGFIPGKKGLSAAGVNVYVRAINSFLTWLYEQGHTPERLRIKPLKTEKKVIATFNEQQIKALLSWKAKNFPEKRLHCLFSLLIDTGIRVNEALTLDRERVDLENTLVTVKGKGNKERTLPISYDMRKILFNWLKQHEFSLVFPTRSGLGYSYMSALDDFKELCKELKITGVRTSFHTLRHTFAYAYVKGGGNVFALQRMLGHETLQMTRRYCELQIEDLQKIHVRTSLLTRLR